MSILLRRHNLWDDSGGIPKKGLISEWLLDERIGDTANYTSYTPDTKGSYPMYVKYANNNMIFNSSGGINASSGYLSTHGGADFRTTDSTFLSNISSTSNWSLSFWWKCGQTGLASITSYIWNSHTTYSTYDSLKIFLNWSSSGNPNAGMYVQYSGNNTYWRFRLVLSSWYHIVITHSSDNKFYCYVNGAEISPTGAQPSSTTNWTTNVGSVNLYGMGFTSSYTQRDVVMQFDNFRFYNKVLTAEEVLLLFYEKNM